MNGPITLEDAGDEDIAQAINQLNDRVTELEEQRRKLRGRIDELEEEVKVAKGGGQPSSKLQVRDSDGKLTEESVKVIRKTRDGPTSDGLRTTDGKERIASTG